LHSDRVEHDAQEYTIVRDGKVIARIVPASERTVRGFLARRAASAAVVSTMTSPPMLSALSIS